MTLVAAGWLLPFYPTVGALFATGVVSLVSGGVLWRCPRCERGLGRYWPMAAWPHCGLVLDERKLAAYGEEKRKVRDTFWTDITRDAGP